MPISPATTTSPPGGLLRASRRNAPSRRTRHHPTNRDFETQSGTLPAWTACPRTTSIPQLSSGIGTACRYRFASCIRPSPPSSPAWTVATRSAPRRSRRSRQAWTAMPSWSFRTSRSPTNSSSPSPATSASSKAMGRVGTSGNARTAGGLLQPGPLRPHHVGRGSRVVLQARRSALALGQLVPSGARQVFAALGACVAVMGRQHRIRRYARRL